MTDFRDDIPDLPYPHVFTYEEYVSGWGDRGVVTLRRKRWFGLLGSVVVDRATIPVTGNEWADTIALERAMHRLAKEANQ